MTREGKHVFTLMIAASFASTIGGLPFNALPILLGSLADSFELTLQQTGMLGSVCFSGYFVGTLASVFVIERICWRKLTIICAFGAISALVCSSFASVEWQAPLWALVGFFAALMTCLGLRIMGQMANKERALGLRQGVELSVTALVLFILPAFITIQFGFQGTALALSAVILILSISVFLLPSNNQQIANMQVKIGGELNGEPTSAQTEATAPKDEATKNPIKYIDPIVWCALAAFFVFGAGNIGLWAFLERIGNSLELAPAEMGTVFAVLKLLGGGAALVIALVGERLGLRWPYALVLLVITFGLVLLWRADSFITFALGAWIWEVGFTWGCVYQTAAVARLDPKGRGIMLIPTAFALSSMVGPGLAGQLFELGYAWLLLWAFGSSIVAALLFAGPLTKGLRQKNSTETDESSATWPVAVQNASLADKA